MNKKSIMYSAVIITMALLMPVRGEGLTIEQVIREVSTKSNDAKSLQENIIKSKEMVREKWSAALPSISGSIAAARSYGSAFSSSSGSKSQSNASVASTEATHSTGTAKPKTPVYWEDLAPMFSSFSEAQTSTIYSTGLSFFQPIYTFGKVGTAIDVAKNFDQATLSSTQRSQQSIQLQAFDEFTQVVTANKLLDIAQRSLARRVEFNEFLARNFNLGSGSKAQVLATKADVARQSITVLTAQQYAVAQRMVLNMLMGRPVTDSLTLDTASGLSVIGALPTVDSAISTAIANRGDLISLRYFAEANKGGAKIFNAMYLPSIGAQGSVGYSKYESGSQLLKMDWTGSWMLGVGLSWTLFDGFANNARSRQYASDARKLEISYNALSNAIEIEMRTDLSECKAADTNLAASKVAYSAAKESYDLLSNDFKQGSGQFNDVRIAEEQLLNAEFGIIQAKYRQLRSRAALQIAMGCALIAKQ